KQGDAEDRDAVAFNAFGRAVSKLVTLPAIVPNEEAQRVCGQSQRYEDSQAAGMVTIVIPVVHWILASPHRGKGGHRGSILNPSLTPDKPVGQSPAFVLECFSGAASAASGKNTVIRVTNRQPDFTWPIMP